MVTAGRTSRGERIYDVPERALPEVNDAPAAAPDRLLLLERVRGAGLLSTAQGPHWSMLSEHRNGPLVDALVAEGALVKVEVEGRRRTYLTVPEHLDAPAQDPDERMRVLGPLDPLLWDRKLVQHVFGFDYIWEVYKPPAQRQWGYYVTPLLHGGRLVGRMEARRVGEGKKMTIEVEKTWGEVQGPAFDEALHALLAHQERAC